MADSLNFVNGVIKKCDEYHNKKLCRYKVRKSLTTQPGYVSGVPRARAMVVLIKSQPQTLDLTLHSPLHYLLFRLE